MKKMLRKVLEFVSVIIALIIAVLVAKDLPLESLLRGKEEPVTLAMTEGGLPEDYIGMPAADDIPRIEDAESWEDYSPGIGIGGCGCKARHYHR